MLFQSRLTRNTGEGMNTKNTAMLCSYPFQAPFVQPCVRNSNPERFAFLMPPWFSFPITGFQAVLVQSYHPFSIEQSAHLDKN